MKSGGKVKNPADEIILAKSALLLYNSKNFGSANGMFDLIRVLDIPVFVPMPKAKPKFKKDIYLLGRRRYTASTKEVYILWTNKYN